MFSVQTQRSYRLLAALNCALLIVLAFVLCTESVIVVESLSLDPQAMQRAWLVAMYMIAVSNGLIISVFLLGITVGRLAIRRQGRPRVRAFPFNSRFGRN